MITPHRSLFIGILAGLLGVSLGGLFVTLIMARTVTQADLWGLGFVFFACGAGGALKAETVEIAGQKARDEVMLKERLAKIPVREPGTTVAPVTIATAAVGELEYDDAARLHAWRVAMLRGVMYAEIYDWPFDMLGPEGVNVMDRPDWDKVTDHLRDCAILHKREKSRTRYLEGWDAARARGEIRQGLPLPYPAGPAPVVHSPRCTEAQAAQISQLAQKRKASREGEREGVAA